ncbi:dihydrolipoyl dehydrogenase family protein [Salisediminibacterium beveridgei]|uniref:Mercuric ion reductase n=1 Tax=Salisediminibacterium beveridgei TaxID=632773 RepID=A0A1D7QYX6_9BACI|nr:FAD-dependent oxidoreductase [Salisediminibacterium beveridgei]AOM84202.1 Mercuric ion reductase [Salisediminibacterium beveridgei]
MKKYDVIVIGGGSGGLTVAAGAASFGAKVALIERKALGGDCLNVGCVPSKALIAAAGKVHKARQSEAFGLNVSGKVDLKAVMADVHAAISDIKGHDSKERFVEMGVDVFDGAASFLESDVVAIEGFGSIRGEKIVISTGSSPVVPPINGLNEADPLTNESVFQLEDLPDKLAVIGAGAIGSELAQAFARLGSDVTLIDMADTPLFREDFDIREAIQHALEEELTFIGGATLKKIDNGKKGGHKLNLEKDGQELEVKADRILVAVGRKPNTASLNLNFAGIEVDDKGAVIVDKNLRTTAKNVYAVGDVNGGLQFTHVAGVEGKHVVQELITGLHSAVSYQAVPWVTFTDPEVFHLGKTEKELRSEGADYRVLKQELSQTDRFIAERATTGFVKLLTDKNGRLLGAHAIGYGAGDFMQEAVGIMSRKEPAHSISNVVHPYPTHTEALKGASDQYWRSLMANGIVPYAAEKWMKLKRKR